MQRGTYPESKSEYVYGAGWFDDVKRDSLRK